MARTRSAAVMAVLAASVLGSVLGNVLAPDPAAAFDIHGTWTGSVTCKGIFDGAPQTISSSSTLLIDDNGTLQLAIDAFHYSGLAFFDPAKPDKGELVVIRCDTNGNRTSAEFGGEFGRLKVSTKPSKGTGSISGTSYRASILIADSVYTCKWSYKRLNTNHPGLGGCTAPPPV